MTGAGGEPRDFEALIKDTRRRLVSLERRLRGDSGPPVGAVVGYIAPWPDGWIPLDGRTLLAADWPSLGEVLAPGDPDIVLPTVAPSSGVVWCIRGE